MAKDAMPTLNQNLQLIMATMACEQTDMALEEASISKRNMERSTIFAALAAFYLPLSLATGIFGMNVRGVETKNPLAWWAFVVLAVGLPTLSVVFVWVLRGGEGVMGRFWKTRLGRLTRSWWKEVDVEDMRVANSGSGIDPQSSRVLEEESGQNLEGWPSSLCKEPVVHREEV